MKIRFGRAAVAGLAALALLGAGVSAASAADSVPSDPKFAGTWYPADDNEVPIAPGSTLAWNKQIVAQAAFGDANAALAAPASATGYKYFIVAQGHENDMKYYSATSPSATFSGSMVEPNLTPSNLIGPAGANAPVAGQAAVKAAGGAYSLGLAYTMNSGVTIADGGLYYVHVNIAPGGAYTFSQVEVAKTASTTTVSAPATATEGGNVTVSATVAPSAATGTVQFQDGGVNLGSPVAVSGGSASTTISAIAAGSHSITAVYSGDSTYASSTSSAATITVAGAPKSTTLALTAVSATGQASDSVVYTATVTPSAATGSVAFSAQLAGGSSVALGTVPVSGGVATVTKGGLPAGAWTITAAFTGTGVYQPSTATASLSLTAPANAATPDPQTVTVDVPAGTLTITTPWTVGNPLKLGTLELNQANSTFQLHAPVTFASANDQASGIQVISARAANPHFTAQVASTDFTSASGSFAAGTASLINIAPHQVSGNSLLATNVTPTQISALSNTAQTFATYGGAQLGTAWLSADLNIAGVPSSTPAGTYTATVTFTAF